MSHRGMPRLAVRAPITVTTVRTTRWPGHRRLVAVGRLTRSGGHVTVALALVAPARPTAGTAR